MCTIATRLLFAAKCKRELLTAFEDVGRHPSCDAKSQSK